MIIYLQFPASHYMILTHCMPGLFSAIRNADELSKMMAFFYYGAAKPPCLSSIGDHSHEAIPSIPINSQVC